MQICNLYCPKINFLIFFFLFLGGLGEGVAGALTEGRNNVVIKRLAVPRVPQSGTGAQLLKLFGIDSTAVVAAVKDILKQ